MIAPTRTRGDRMLVWQRGSHGWGSIVNPSVWRPGYLGLRDKGKHALDRRLATGGRLSRALLRASWVCRRGRLDCCTQRCIPGGPWSWAP